MRKRFIVIPAILLLAGATAFWYFRQNTDVTDQVAEEYADMQVVETSSPDTEMIEQVVGQADPGQTMEIKEEKEREAAALENAGQDVNAGSVEDTGDMGTIEDVMKNVYGGYHEFTPAVPVEKTTQRFGLKMDENPEAAAAGHMLGLSSAMELTSSTGYANSIRQESKYLNVAMDMFPGSVDGKSTLAEQVNGAVQYFQSKNMPWIDAGQMLQKDNTWAQEVRARSANNSMEVTRMQIIVRVADGFWLREIVQMNPGFYGEEWQYQAEIVDEIYKFFSLNYNPQNFDRVLSEGEAFAPENAYVPDVVDEVFEMRAEEE